MKNNIIFLLAFSICVICICALTSEQREKLFKFQNECLEETGATDEMVMNAYAGKFTDAPEFKNHLVCVGKKGGIIDDEGNYHKDVLKEKMMMFIDDETKVDELLEKCGKHYDTPQESAFHMTKCLYDEHFGM
nr:odorant binding protein 1 [Euplatypus parallelus]